MESSFSSLPGWFRRWGLGVWVGMVLVLIGAVWLLGKTGPTPATGLSRSGPG